MENIHHQRYVRQKVTIRTRSVLVALVIIGIGFRPEGHKLYISKIAVVKSSVIVVDKFGNTNEADNLQYNIFKLVLGLVA